MVCLPCFIIPVLLYVFHKFIQPLMLKFWNPWEKKDEQGNVIKQEPKLFDCSDGKCTFAFGKSKKELNAQENNKTGETGNGDSTLDKKDE